MLFCAACCVLPAPPAYPPACPPACLPAWRSDTVGFKRRTFVGSPLWMAPEVIEQSPDTLGGFRGGGVGGKPGEGDAEAEGEGEGSGYDEAADIWSLGITAMEVRARRAGGTGGGGVCSMVCLCFRTLPPRLAACPPPAASPHFPTHPHPHHTSHTITSTAACPRSWRWASRRGRRSLRSACSS